jgi:hypothetical protein
LQVNICKKKNKQNIPLSGFRTLLFFFGDLLDLLVVIFFFGWDFGLASGGILFIELPQVGQRFIFFIVATLLFPTIRFFGVIENELILHIRWQFLLVH